MATSAELALLFKTDGADAVNKALKGVASGIAGAREEASKGGGLLGTFAKGAAATGLAAAAAGVAAVGAAALGARYALSDLVPAAEGLGDAVARATLVFKDYDSAAGDILKDNAQVANSLGLTKEAYIASAAKLGDLLTSMNVGAESAFNMSVELTELAPKLAAFAGVDADQAMDALAKGVTGATRGLKEMGIIIPDIPKGLNDAAAAAFIYDEILKQSADATTAWADNAGDMEVQSARLSSAIHDTKAAIGEALLPVVSALTSKLMDYLIPALGIVQAVFTGDWAGGGNQALDDLREKAGPLADVILHVSYAVSDVVDAFERLVSGDPQGFWDMLGNSVYSLVEGFGALTGLDISGIIDTLFGGDRDAGDGLWQEIGEKLVELKDKLLNLWDNAKVAWAGVMAAVDAAKPYIVDAIAIMREVAGYLYDKWIELKDGAVDLWGQISQAIEDAKPRIDEAIKDIKEFAADLSKKWTELKDDAADIWGRISSFVYGSRDTQQQALRMMGEDSDVLKNQWRGLVPEAQAAWAGITQAIANSGPVIDDILTNILGPAWDDLKLVWAELKETAMVVWGNITTYIADKSREIKEWWAEHGEAVKLIFAGMYLTITGIIKTGWAIIIGIIRVAMALIRGDNEGLKEAFAKMWDDVIAGVKRILGGLAAIVGGILADTAKSIGGEAAEIGKSIVDGIWGAIIGGKGKVADAGASIGNAAAAGTKAAVQSFSPSRVFEEIGLWIVQGLAGGIDKNAQKAVEAAAKMAGDVTGAAKNLVELFTTLASKEAQQSTAGAADRFKALVAAMRPFRDMLVAVGQEMRTPLKGSTTELGAISKGAEGLGKVADAIKSIAEAVTALGGSIKTTTGGKGGTVTETITGILPDESALRKLADRARVMLDMMRSLQDTFGPATGMVGAGGLADAVKAMADMLNAAADVDLSKAVEVTSLQMVKARHFLGRMVSIFSEPGGLLDLFSRMEEDVREAVRGGAGAFADVVGALADVLKIAGGFTEKLVFNIVDVEAAGRAALDVAQKLQAIFDDKGGLLDVFLRLPEKVRELLSSGAKQFADLLGSLVKVLEISEVGKIAPALEVSASDLVAVLTQLMVLDKYVLPDIRNALKKTTEQLEAASKDLKAMADYFVSIAAVLKASEVRNIDASLEVSAAALIGVLTQLMVLEKYVLRDIREQIRKTTEQLIEASKDLKAMGDWFGAIASVVRAGQVGEVESALEVSASQLIAVLTQLMVIERYVLPDIRAQIRKTTEQLGEASKDFKAMAEWFGSIASVLKATEIGELHPALIVSASALRDVLLTVQNLVKSVLEPMRKQLMGMGDLDAMADDFKELAKFVGSVADILESTTKLPGADQIPEITAEVADRMLVPISILATAFAKLAPDINAAANEALASLGPAIDALSSVFEALETAIASPFFGSGTRARSSSSMEVFKRRIVESIRAAIDTLVTAIRDADIPADLATKFAPLQAVAEAIKSAFDSLASVKLPADLDKILEAARKLAGLMAGGGAGAGGGIGGTGGGSAGGGGLAGGILKAIAAELDGWKGDSSCAKPIMTAIAAELDGWRGDTGCAPPIFKAVAAELDGWRGDTGCAPPIFKAIGEQLEAWVQRGSTGIDLGGVVFHAIGEQVEAWVQRGSTGTDIGSTIMAAIGSQIDAWVQRGSTGPGPTGGSGGGAGIFGAGGIGTMALSAQSVNLAGPITIGMNATLNIGGGRTLSAELVDALIADTASFDKLIKAEDRRRAQNP